MSNFCRKVSVSILKRVYKRNFKSWNDLYTSLLKIPNDIKHSEAGRQFETFAKHYFKILPEIKAVYFLEDTPSKLRKELNIEGVDDGVDLVIIDKRNRKIAVQVKFVKDQNKEISWSSKKLANTVGHGKFDAHWFFSNSKGICARTKLHAKDPEQVFIQDLEELSKSSIRRIISSIHSTKLPPKIRFKPKKHQENAIKEVVKKFKTTDRGQLILPCGAGKTLTSLWIKEKLKPKLTLVLVPSLSLLRQFKSSWLEQSKKDFDFFCVCGEKGVDKDTMNSRYEIGRTGLGVTTKPKEIREFIKYNKTNLVVFCTYQSSNKIQNALKNTRIKFDLVVCDEAHRTATRHAANFAIVHDNKKIKAVKRLYMTATPRIISDSLVRKQIDITKYVADMCNPKVFGEELFKMSFAEAIKLGLLVDYKILAVGVTKEEVQKQIDERRYVRDKNTTIEDIANIVALNKVIKKHKTSHALTFHSSIKRAENFRDKYKELFPRSWIDTVTGRQKTRDRKLKLNEYEAKAKGILTNSRCLTEGIDVSKIDCVYFCDPKNSKIDIVQACGRALRLDKKRKNKIGYIVCPIFHTKNCDDVDQFIKDSNFSNIIAILRAMNDHDDRLAEEIKSLVYGKGKRTKAKKGLGVSIDSPLQIDLAKFSKELQDKIYIETVRKSLPKVKWMPFEDARKFAQGLKLKNSNEWRLYTKNELATFLKGLPKNIPVSPERVYLGCGWSGYGDWLGTGRIADQNKVYRNFETAKIFVHKLKLKSQKEWIDYCKGFLSDTLKLLPVDIPRTPNVVYKNSGWTNLGDWLGTGVKHSRDIKYLPFYKARKFARSLNLVSQKEWILFAKGMSKKLNKKLPENIPANPAHLYREKGWKGYGDFLGTGRVADQFFKYPSYKEARYYVHRLKLKNQNEWRDYCRGDLKKKKPRFITSNPHRTYKNKGWKGLGDWLGTKRISNESKIFYPFSEARNLVYKNGIDSQAKYRSWYKVFNNSKNKNKLLPSNPHSVYKNQWKGYGDFLGTGVMSPRYKRYRSYSKAKNFVKELKFCSNKEWRLYCSGKLSHLEKPIDIPSNADSVYRGKGWVSWPDFLGTTKSNIKK